ncbi:MAG: hypothetical protein RIS35_2800 [Pseudomonadota bacterium]
MPKPMCNRRPIRQVAEVSSAAVRIEGLAATGRRAECRRDAGSSGAGQVSVSRTRETARTHRFSTHAEATFTRSAADPSKCCLARLS